MSLPCEYLGGSRKVPRVWRIRFIMLQLNFEGIPDETRLVLCIGAHCDDIEIGCGGSILRWAGQYPRMSFVWVVLSSDEVRAHEARRSAEKFLAEVRQAEVIIKTFRNGYFPFDGAEIKDFFEVLKSTVSPDIIFTHYRKDRHQDHRLVSDLTWNTFRDHFILEYEIFKYDGDMGIPNFFVPLKETVYTKKIDIILECFKSQADRHWFDREAFLSLMRLRGVEANSASGYAEAFYCRKAVI